MAGSASVHNVNEENKVDLVRMRFTGDVQDCSDDLCQRLKLDHWATVLSVRAVSTDQVEVLVLKGQNSFEHVLALLTVNFGD